MWYSPVCLSNLLWASDIRLGNKKDLLHFHALCSLPRRLLSWWGIGYLLPHLLAQLVSCSLTCSLKWLPAPSPAQSPALSVVISNVWILTDAKYGGMSSMQGAEGREKGSTYFSCSSCWRYCSDVYRVLVVYGAALMLVVFLLSTLLLWCLLCSCCRLYCVVVCISTSLKDLYLVLCCILRQNWVHNLVVVSCSIMCWYRAVPSVGIVQYKVLASRSIPSVGIAQYHICVGITQNHVLVSRSAKCWYRAVTSVVIAQYQVLATLSTKCWYHSVPSVGIA